MNLILLDAAEMSADQSVALSGPRATHIRKVLEAQVGGTVRVGVLDGVMGIGTVTAIDGDRVTLQCILESRPPDLPKVDVLLALPRPKVMRRLWAQLAALGVGQVILTNAEKVERDYFDSHVLDSEGFRPLLIEGLQQAKDTRVPAVSIHKRFKVLVEDDLDTLFPAGRRIVAHPGGEASIARALSSDGRAQRVKNDERVLIAIGPEGGWNDFELGLLDAHGFVHVSMGPRTLATTTACIALLTLVHEALRSGGASR